MLKHTERVVANELIVAESAQAESARDFQDVPSQGEPSSKCNRIRAFSRAAEAEACAGFAGKARRELRQLVERWAAAGSSALLP